jgi:flagellar biogenesis protein FliO
MTEETSTPPREESGAGATVASVIVVLVIIAGAFYLFNRVQEQRQRQLPPEEVPTLEVLVTDNSTGTIELTSELSATSSTNGNIATE